MNAVVDTANTTARTALPASVLAKLKRVDEEIEDGKVILRGLSAGTDRAREKLTEARMLLGRALAASKEQPVHLRGKPNPTLEASIASHESEIAKQRRFLERNERAEERLNARLSALEELRRRVADWQYALDPEFVVTAFAGEIKLPANTDLDHIRQKILRTKANIRELQDAPRSLDELEACVDREIERLRQIGAPSFARMIDGASDEVRWPHHEQVLQTIGLAKGGGSVNSVGRFTSTDVPAMLCWLWPEIISNALRAELRAQLGGDGIGSEERAKRLMALRKELLSLERVEEVIIEREQPEAPRRADLDLRAFLGLTDDVPVPSGED